MKNNLLDWLCQYQGLHTCQFGIRIQEKIFTQMNVLKSYTDVIPLRSLTDQNKSLH